MDGCGYMLVEEKPIGVVSVTKGLIEDLYILPDMQNMGYGTLPLPIWRVCFYEIRSTKCTMRFLPGY